MSTTFLSEKGREATKERDSPSHLWGHKGQPEKKQLPTRQTSDTLSIKTKKNKRKFRNKSRSNRDMGQNQIQKDHGSGVWYTRSCQDHELTTIGMLKRAQPRKSC